MAQSISVGQITYKRYDAGGGDVEQNATLTLNPPGSGLESLSQTLLEFNAAQAALLQEANKNAEANHLAETLKAFLFPNHEQQEALESQYRIATAKLSHNIKAYVQHAIAERDTGVFGKDAKQAEYKKVSVWLRKLGEYVESVITETPWHQPVAKEAYLLVALKESPEAFIAAQQDQEVGKYVDELNRAKRQFPEEKFHADKSNLSDQLKRYLDNVRLKCESFKAQNSKLIAEIRAIEEKRANRFGITNFFVDLFTSEKKNLNTLKIRAEVNNTLEKSYQKLAESAEPLQKVSNLYHLGNKLINDPEQVTPEEMAELYAVINELQNSPKYKSHVAGLVERLQQKVLANVNSLLDNTSNEVGLSKQLSFLASNAVKDVPVLESVRVAVREHIKSVFTDEVEVEKALGFIAQLEKIAENVLKAFDITIYQFIQDKKNQYQSVQLLQSDWDKLLSDAEIIKLSDDQVDQFIAAALWLDKPNSAVSNPLIEALNKLSGTELNKVQQIAKAKLTELQKTMLADLKQLAKESLGEEKQHALRQRIKFASQANTIYTGGLGNLRAAVLQAITQKLESETNLQEFDRYVKNLKAVLPEELQSDEAIKQAVQKAKKNFVKEHFTEQQKKCHAKYEHEIEFLRTGDLKLWDRVKSVITKNDRKALTEENLTYWRQEFNRKYQQLINEAAESASSNIYATESAEDKVIYCNYLKELIADDFASVSKPLSYDLSQLVDLRRQAALKRLDDIFGLEPSKPVDIGLFMMRYVALAQYQSSNSKDATLVEAGREFIGQFHKMAQHEGGFITQLVAKLPLDALDAMYLTWQKDPEVKFVKESKDAPMHLRGDIIGEVGASQNTHIQLPRHLLIQIVLQLIVADFDALLRGKTIDTKLLNDRIQFAIPKLAQQVKYEEELSANSKDLRRVLQAELSKLTTPELNDRYAKLVSQLTPSVVKCDKFGVVTNLAACESALLAEVKGLLADQLAILKGLDFHVNAIEAINKELKVLAAKFADSNSDDKVGISGSIAKLVAERVAHQQSIDAEDENSHPELDYSLEVSAIKEINEHLESLRGHLWDSYSGDKPSVIEVIAELEKQRKTHQESMDAKKAKAIWLKQFKAYVPALCALLADEKDLRQFVLNINEKLFELLPANIAHVCRVLRNNVVLAQLVNNDASFSATCKRLNADLGDSNTNIINIVRELPESITREFPAQTADMIRQLQYRFADRFKDVMVKMLKSDHLESLQKAQITEARLSLASKSSPESGAFFGGLFSAKHTRDAKSAEAKQDVAASSVNDRLGNVLKSIDSDVMKKMLGQLASAADSKQISLAHLYQIQGKTAPIAVPTQQPQKPVQALRGSQSFFGKPPACDSSLIFPFDEDLDQKQNGFAEVGSPSQETRWNESQRIYKPL